MFEKLNGRGREIEFLSWSSIEFGLYLFDESVRNSVKISSFRNVLADKLVCVFYQPLLPRTIRIGKIDDNPFESFGYLLMSRELAAIVSCNGQYACKPVGVQQSDYGFGNLFGVLSMRQL